MNTPSRIVLVSFVLVLSLHTSTAADPASVLPKPVPAAPDVSYGPSPLQLLDVYVPANGSKPFPVLLWFGGIWKPAKGVPDLNHFLPQGIALIGVQTRTMSEAVAAKEPMPVSYVMNDACRAVQFVRLNAARWNLDPQRIAVGGGSQGTLPALYVGCSADRANPQAADPVERMSTKVTCVAAWRSQPSIDPKRMQEWVPGVRWGEPALGCSFDESLKRREELLPVIRQWSPDALVHKGAAPIFFENEWGLTQPEGITEINYKVHSPAWALGFQKLAQQAGAVCHVKFPDHPVDGYANIWDFIVKQLKKATGSQPKPPIVRLILDTDMSGDCDDAGALALVHALADRGECDLLAVVTNRKDKTNASAAAVDAINTYYGRPELPIGTDKVGPTDLQRTSSYTSALRDEFPQNAKPDDQMPDALAIYRRVLVSQPDESVTICSVGALSNVAELWRQAPELVVTKVRRLVVMGGEFPKGTRPETNIRTHVAAARVVASEWPGEIVWHGFEIGKVLITGAGLKQAPDNNPVRRSYELKPCGNRPAIEGGQPSWDQGAALFAVRGADPALWRTVRGGHVAIDEQGVTQWEAGPITRHHYMELKGDPARLAAVIEELMAQPKKMN